MSKKLYALTDEQARDARRAVDYQLDRALRASDSEELSSAYAALAPLDREDSVERITEAMIAASPDRDFITEDEREWYTRDARAALDALLGGGQA